MRKRPNFTALLSVSSSITMLGVLSPLTSANDNSNNNFVKGIDLSHFNKVTNWKAVKGQGYSFVFIKATQGVTVTDANFAKYWQEAGKTGLVRGAYHYLSMKADVRSQFEHFDQTVQLKAGDLPPAIDFEPPDCTQASVEKLHKFYALVQNKYHTAPIIYVSLNSYQKLVADKRFGRCIFWVAKYGSDHAPNLPDNCKFWQWEHSQPVNGIDGTVDVNEFALSLGVLKSLALKMD